MANESVTIELGLNGGNVVRRTVYDLATISKGSLCIMSGGNNEAAKSTANTGNPKAAFAGIASADKISGDGSTTLGFYMGGVHDLTSATGAIFGNCRKRRRDSLFRRDSQNKTIRSLKCQNQ